MVSEGLQHRAAGLLSNAGHPVVLTAVHGTRIHIHRVSRLDGWILVEVVVRPQQDPAAISYCDRVGNVLGVGDVKEASGHPGNQVLGTHVQTYHSKSSS